MAAERAFLVTLQLDTNRRGNTLPWRIEDEARELYELAVGGGCRVVGEIHARRHHPVSATWVGEGKLLEIANEVDRSQAKVVIFNQELSPAQQRNIEDRLKVKTIDRTQLILDIFAQRAKSQEGKIQVELAQLRYLLPRLAGKGIILSRLGGGIGTRGPGEQKIEVDRRRIRRHITHLKQVLERVGERRKATRSRRKEASVPIAALVGYTNAGKTTLLNKITGSFSSVRRQLFTTLDPLARKLKLPLGGSIVLTDTVGFLHGLPHNLIEAFKATLEEARDADIILHVLDVSNPSVIEHVEAVEGILHELNLHETPRLAVLNKCDQVLDKGRLLVLQTAHLPAVTISAKTGEGIDNLLRVLTNMLHELLSQPVRFKFPAARVDCLSRIYNYGQVSSRVEKDGAIEIIARVPDSLKSKLSSYILS